MNRRIPSLAITAAVGNAVPTCDATIYNCDKEV